MSNATASAWLRIGHTTLVEARTGCTVLLFDHLSPARVDVRGGAPGTRETDLLQAGRLVGGVDAIVLTGGSAFGLASIDGVVRWLAEQGRGFPTAARPVPIVAGAVIFDLANGLPDHPTANDGYAAAAGATPIEDGVQHRFHGAGVGATVAKLGGVPAAGGIGVVTRQAGEFTVTAVVVLNAIGDVMDPRTGRMLAQASLPDGSTPGAEGLVLGTAGEAVARAGEATTIGAVLFHQPVNEAVLQRATIAAHAGLARCVFPSHTLFDGDTMFSCAPALGELAQGQALQATTLAQVAMEDAICSIFTGAAGSTPVWQS